MHTITKGYLSTVGGPIRKTLLSTSAEPRRLKDRPRNESACSAMERTKYQSSKIESNQDSIFMVTQKWNGTEGARLLREMRVYLRLRRLKAEEAQGPPAE
ncbi:hypothetical protein [Peribacillus sp. FSL E2-0218]|uniref:hypothetical protein n=1 Tax=Peribacillus sp. FSL E2-0218 TaxID=2921364 RepID=UPI0030EE6871